jgi:hypothetical protein
MIRILRAFVWLRWRMLINSLEKTGARDTIERFSLAIENLGPIMAAVLMIPSGLALAVLGAGGGYALASGNTHSLLFETSRYILLPVVVLSLVGPLMLPAADRSNPVRLLLLPISRRTLYVAQSSSTIGDPWVALMLPLVLCLPLGLLAGGAITAALIGLVGALLLVIVIIGLSSLATSLLHLAVRDRRRGELLALLFIMILPMIGVLPGLLEGSGHRRARAEGAEVRRERVVPPWIAAAGERAFTLVPTELFISATREAAEQDLRSSGGPLFGLVMGALLLHGLGAFAFGRVLDSPGSTGARRAVPMRAAWGRRLPGFSTGASAVALAQLRLGLRTPRGRSIMLSPLMMLVVFGVIMHQRPGGMDLGPISLHSGLGLAAFASFISLMAILPIAMNQFAVDRAGLTMALLAPLDDREYLTGKAVGNALIAGPPAAFSIVASFVAFPGGSLALWMALPLALVATYLLVAPAAAACSALFPRVVDLNSIGRGSNAHGLAGLIGLFSFVVAAAPCVLIGLGVSRWLHNPVLVPLALLAWCGVAYGIGRVLFIPARRIFLQRRENLAMLRTSGSTQ